jgi:polyferredoxin
VIRAIQWSIVAFYLALLVIPVLLPVPSAQARILDQLTVAAQFIFWGIWWPFVLLSTLLVGRVWCGVFCPEGALTEWASASMRKPGAPSGAVDTKPERRPLTAHLYCRSAP